MQEITMRAVYLSLLVSALFTAACGEPPVVSPPVAGEVPVAGPPVDCRHGSDLGQRVISTTSVASPLIAAGPNGYLVAWAPDWQKGTHFEFYNEKGLLMGSFQMQGGLGEDDKLIGTENGFTFSKSVFGPIRDDIFRFDVNGRFIVSKEIKHPWVNGPSGPRDMYISLMLGAGYDEGHDLLVFPGSNRTNVNGEWVLDDTLHFHVLDTNGEETVAWKFNTNAHIIPRAIALNGETIALVSSEVYVGSSESRGSYTSMIRVLTMRRDGSRLVETRIMDGLTDGRSPITIMKNGDGFLFMTGKDTDEKPNQRFLHKFKVGNQEGHQFSSYGLPLPDTSSGLVPAPGGQFRTLVHDIADERFRVVTMTDVGNVIDHQSDLFGPVKNPIRGGQLVAIDEHRYAVLWAEYDGQLRLYTHADFDCLP